MVYDGRVLEVGEWKKSHPGSEKVIEAHLGEDITDLWSSIHPGYALGLVSSLQVGWVEPPLLHSMVQEGRDD
jgi:cytochrome b involved in lipid metabolism